ncbi:MAG: ribosome maturation factor RimM [Calditrichia bacterium]
MATTNNTHIAVGKVIQAHGMDGYLKAMPYSGFPQRFQSLRTVYVETSFGMQGFIVEDVRLQQKSALLKLRGVNSRDEAQRFGKADLLVPAEQAIELPDNNYFVHDLIDMNVVDQKGNHLGAITEVLTNSGNDIYVVRDGDKELLIPAVEAFIKDVNVADRRMTVELIEGMLG